MKKLFFLLVALLLTSSLSFLLGKPIFAAGNPCCSNPYPPAPTPGTRSGWSYDQDSDRCSAIAGMARETRPIECDVTREYCYPSGGVGICTLTGTTPTGVPTPPGGSCSIEQPCCDRGLSGAPRYYCNSGSPSEQNPACVCEAVSRTSPTIPVYDPGCTPGSTDNVKTALGCLPTDPQQFVNTALPWTIGIGAGIAFLLGVFGSMMIVLSAGNPEKMQAGKEMITSAVAGLLLIIFAVLILNVVGVKVLNLFDFSEPPHPGGGGR